MLKYCRLQGRSRGCLVAVHYGGVWRDTRTGDRYKLYTPVQPGFLNRLEPVGTWRHTAVLSAYRLEEITPHLVRDDEV
jgi:hypothetical protein